MHLPQKPQPYVGLVTRDASPELSAQLRQPEGFGLVIDEVLPDSPAKAAGLERNDLLIRFEDQLLVNPPQLEALVRRAGKDKETNLTILRGGAEQKITIKVGERMLPERRIFRGMMSNRFPSEGFHGSGEGRRELYMRSDANGPREDADGGRQVRYLRERARVQRSDEDGRFELIPLGGTRTFIAQKPNGDVIWRGPVETPEQREAVPREIRGKLEMLLRGIDPEREHGERPAPERPAEPLRR
jgi:hypothetical protein